MWYKPTHSHIGTQEYQMNWMKDLKLVTILYLLTRTVVLASLGAGMSENDLGWESRYWSGFKLPMWENESSLNPAHSAELSQLNTAVNTSPNIGTTNALVDFCSLS